jgi:hypothetical protein
MLSNELYEFVGVLFCPLGPYLGSVWLVLSGSNFSLGVDFSKRRCRYVFLLLHSVITAGPSSGPGWDSSSPLLPWPNSTSGCNPVNKLESNHFGRRLWWPARRTMLSCGCIHPAVPVWGPLILLEVCIIAVLALFRAGALMSRGYSVADLIESTSLRLENPPAASRSRVARRIRVFLVFITSMCIPMINVLSSATNSRLVILHHSWRVIIAMLTVAF